MVKVSVVKPKPGQDLGEALRTAPVREVDQSMWAACPKAIIDLQEPGTPGAHYDADGKCQCVAEKKREEALKHSRKVGWGEGKKLWHLVIRGEEPRSPEMSACGVDLASLRGREIKPISGMCVKCRAYAAKRRWL